MSLSPSRKPEGSDVGVGVVELDPEGAAVLADRHRLVEPAVDDPQLVEQPQRGAGEVAELGVVPLALQLGDDDDREDHLVLVEALAARRGRPAGRWCRGRRCATERLAGRQRLRRLLALVGTGHPSRTGARTPRPALSSHCSGPGGSPKAGVPASTRDPQRHRWCSRGSCITQDRASRYGGFPTRRWSRKYAAERPRPVRHARRDGVNGACRHADRGRDGQAPKRRSRWAYARIARRKSTRRKSGQ